MLTLHGTQASQGRLAFVYYYDGNKFSPVSVSSTYIHDQWHQGRHCYASLSLYSKQGWWCPHPLSLYTYSMQGMKQCVLTLKPFNSGVTL